MWASIMAGLGVAGVNAAIRNGDMRLLGRGAAALEAALARTSSQDRRYPYLAAALSTALRERYQRQRVPADLDRAVELARQAAAAAPSGHPQHGWAQETLARALTLRAVEDGDARALDAAVEAGHRSLEGEAVRQREAATRRTALGIALKARYDLAGSDQDLAESIAHIRAAQAVQLRGDQDRAAVALNYALSYLADFARYGRLSDLDAAIENLAAAASLPEPPSRLHLVALSRAFRLRHEALGRLEDVDAAVCAARQAAGGEPLRDPEAAAVLSAALAARSRSVGEPGDLDEAVTIAETAVGLTSEGGARSEALLALGQLLTVRFEDRADPSDINGAVDHLRAALASTTEQDPGRAAYLDSLGQALWARREGGAGSDTDVLESARLLQAAVAATPEDHQQAAGRLGNLAAALWTRFEITRDHQDLDAAISSGEKALTAVASAWAARTRLLLNLGIAYNSRFDEHGGPQDAQRAIAVWREATQLADVRAGMRIGTARNYGDLAMRAGDPETALAGYDTAIRMLPEAAWRGLSTAGQQRILASWGRLAGEAAAAALSAGQAGRAVEMAETGSSVSWEHALALGAALESLREAAPELAERITRTAAAMTALQA